MDSLFRKENEMEDIAPPLGCAMQIRSLIEAGVSPHQAIQTYIQSYKSDFSKQLLKWFIHINNKSSSGETLDQLSLSPHRRVLIETLEIGLKGQPIYQRLVELESELVEVSRREIEKQAQNLSFKLLIPLFLFQVPAFFLLLIGPIFLQLLERLNT